MINYSTEYLIIHEDELDWDKISADRDDMFSLVEIRLFRSKINWRLYIENHLNTCPFTVPMMELASKYFDENIYTMLASFNLAEEEFIMNHLKDFDFKVLIKNSKLDEEFLLSTMDYWLDIPNIEEIFRKSKFIDLESPNYGQIKLILEVSK